MSTAKKKRPISYHLVNVGIGFLALFAHRWHKEVAFLNYLAHSRLLP